MKISFMGTGLMGRPMAKRLLQAGYEVTVYNRTREKALPLETLGAKVALSPREAVVVSPIIILMVADYSACREVLFPAMETMGFEGKTIVQMGTIFSSPECRFNDSCQSKGAVIDLGSARFLGE